MACESMLFVTNHIPYLGDLSYSFPNSFIDFYSCYLVVSCFVISERTRRFMKRNWVAYMIVNISELEKENGELYMHAEI